MLGSIYLLFALYACCVSATHYTCSWQPGRAVPSEYKYKHYCSATIGYHWEKTNAIYKCQAGGVGAENTWVADWGYFHPNLLEFATPCGEGGYGVDEAGHCLGPYFGVCIGDENTGNCFYMRSHDDCLWPEFFFYDTNLPQKLQIWYYVGGNMDEEFGVDEVQVRRKEGRR